MPPKKIAATDSIHPEFFPYRVCEASSGYFKFPAETICFPCPRQRRDRFMERQSTGTWRDDPSHFVRPTRRAFLHVGLVGALGLTLDQYFRLQHVQAETASAGAQEPKAKSLIHIFLPGGMAHQES